MFKRHDSRSSFCCLQEVITCGRYSDDGTEYPCPEGYHLPDWALDYTDPIDPSDCCVWTPTCAKGTGPSGAAFSCPAGTKPLANASLVTVISNETCCVSGNRDRCTTSSHSVVCLPAMGLWSCFDQCDAESAWPLFEKW